MSVHRVQLAVTRAAALTTLGITALLAFGAGPAAASHVQCADVITEDTTLDSDLVDCPWIGVVIRADDVTLDLDGHTIDGDGDEYGAGIHSAGFDGVTIEGGTVTEFEDGVRLDGRESIVRRLTLRANYRTGITVSGSGHRIEHNRLESNFWTGMSFGVSASEIRDNAVSGSFYATGGSLTDSVFRANSASVNKDGFRVIAVDSRVTRNLAVGNEGPGIVVASVRSDIDGNVALENGYDGIAINMHSHFDRIPSNRIRRNVARRNGRDGISVGDPVFGSPAHSEQNTIEGNRVSRNGRHGLYLVDAADSVLERNRATGNGATGITLVLPWHNRIADNTLSENGADGIAIYGRDRTQDNLLSGNRSARNAGAGISVGGTGNRVEGNVTTGNLGDGIIVWNVLPNFVEGNVANRNGDDGIDLNDEAASTVARNTTNGNRDLGISSFEGVLDGGGNRARHNGNPLQCLVVQCNTG